MSRTRTYQCPGCGELYPTKRDPTKYFTCLKCKARGLISKHSVSTPMTIAQKSKAARKGHRAREAAAGAAEEVASEARPFSKDQLLGRIEMAKETATTSKDHEGDIYQCADCNGEITKGQKHCPHCGKQLDWSGVGD